MAYLTSQLPGWMASLLESKVKVPLNYSVDSILIFGRTPQSSNKCPSKSIHTRKYSTGQYTYAFVQNKKCYSLISWSPLSAAHCSAVHRGARAVAVLAGGSPGYGGKHQYRTVRPSPVFSSLTSFLTFETSQICNIRHHYDNLAEEPAPFKPSSNPQRSLSTKCSSCSRSLLRDPFKIMRRTSENRL